MKGSKKKRERMGRNVGRARKMGQRRFFLYDSLLQKITVWSAFVVLGWFYVETGITSLMDFSGKSQCQFLNLSIIL